MSGLEGSGPLTPAGSALFRIRKTILKMLSKRGYNVDIDALNMTTGEFAATYGEDPSREQMKMLVEKIMGVLV